MFVNMLARLLARPRIAAWIIRRGRRHGAPFHIKRPDGSTYMGRWWLLKWGERLRNVLPAIRLHHLADRDRDRHLHDHPWDFRTFVLTGGYTEELITGDHVDLLAGQTSGKRAQDFHRITEVQSNTWTLFVTWRWRNDWGFLVDGRKIPHDLYAQK